MREMLRSGRPLYGPIVQLADPAVVEIAGLAGFDYVMVDAEHSALGIDRLPDHLRAAQARAIGALVRVAADDHAGLLRVLDAGAEGVLVSGVRSAAAARELVSSVRYPPQGTRALHVNSRHAGFGRHGHESAAALMAAENDALVLGLLIGDEPAVDGLSEMLAGGGIDLVVVGIGLWTKGDAADRAVTACRQAGVVFGTAVGHQLHALAAAELRPRGARVFVMANDASALGRVWADDLARERGAYP